MLTCELRNHAALEPPALRRMTCRTTTIDLESVLDIRSQSERPFEFACSIGLSLRPGFGEFVFTIDLGRWNGFGNPEKVDAVLQTPLCTSSLPRVVELCGVDAPTRARIQRVLDDVMRIRLQRLIDARKRALEFFGGGLHRHRDDQAYDYQARDKNPTRSRVLNANANHPISRSESAGTRVCRATNRPKETGYFVLFVLRKTNHE
jgi:hypothetical protein